MQVWTVFLLIALHVVGVSLFTRGFLLARLALPNVAPPVSLPRTHTRAVVLIIDALRFDFVVSPPGRHNALSLPSRLSAHHPTHSLLFNAYADPPTATLQRIKAITTGSLPTFIDIGNNFDASSISEDSLLTQAHLAGKTVSFMGDDTWMGLFPDAFHPNMTFPYDSFNVEDLHTVDQGVITHLFPLLHDPSEPFDLLIGHFLGVDHVGHRLGPDHPSMTAKLEEMNSVLERVVDIIDDDTLLVVLGDHGMDRSGDHGGDGDLETSAALWIYSKGPALASSDSVPPSTLLPLKTFPGSSTPHRAVQQIDILPTISLLLGLPIPFNNLGSVIPEIFWRSADNKDKHLLQRALELNANQIRTFLDAYRASASGTRELDDAWPDIQSAWDTISSFSGDGNAQERLIALYQFNRLALAACRAMWAQFNPVLMAFGLAVLAFAWVAACFVYTSLPARERSHLDIRRCADSQIGSRLFQPGLGPCLDHSCVARTIPIPSSPPSRHPHSPPPHHRPFSKLVHVLEDRIVPFFLSSLLLLTTSSIRLHPPTPLSAPDRRWSVVVLVCVRLMSVSTVCREEQQPILPRPRFSLLPSRPEPPLLVRVLVLQSWASRCPQWLRVLLGATKSNGGVAPLVVTGVVTPSLISGTVFWIAEWVDSTYPLLLGGGGMLRSVRTGLAWFAIGWPVVVGLGAWYLFPVCLTITLSSSEPRAKVGAGRQATVLGFANAYGAPYLVFWLLFYCVVHASVQLTAQLVLALALLAMLAFVELVDSIRDARAMEAFFRAQPSSASALPSLMKTKARTEETACLRFSDTAPLSLLALLAFFATGHQSTVSSIQWKSAFLLSDTVQYPSSPFTVVVNSVGPVALVAGLGAPLLALWNRAPSSKSKSKSEPESESESELGGTADNVSADAIQAGMGVMIYFSALLLGAATSAAVLRRHLMVWKVFAPRFMVAVVHVGVVDVGVLVGVCGGVRRVVRRVSRVFRGAVGGI
ncbi:hypothetical protein APHAL10511_008468 [Amanita phalloides]|nr:hypothetical protein APHAL10511_008468 [Amanita phalloides]